MQKSKIEWTDKTWNPIVGCSRISEGCRNCYALDMLQRFKGANGWPLDSKPTLINRAIEKIKTFKKNEQVFVCSMSDFFHPEIGKEEIINLYMKMCSNSNPYYLILTKRPEEIQKFEPFFASISSDARFNRIIHGVTVESGLHKNRIEVLKSNKFFKYKYLSIEPMLGDISNIDFSGIDWVIFGGESGNRARDLNLGALKSGIEKAKSAGCKVFVKQLGSGFNRKNKGNDMEEWPDWARIREYGPWIKQE